MALPIIPKVKTVFCISGYELDIHDVNERMQVGAAELKEKKDFSTEKDITNEWKIEIKKEYCRAISYHFEELIEILQGKEETINAICEQYNATAAFKVYIFRGPNGGPEVWLEKEMVSFADSINAEIDFNLHIYKPLERLFRIAEQLLKRRSYREQCK